MSKIEHDYYAAKVRSCISDNNRPWYVSSLSALKVIDNFNICKCLDLCSGNCDFSQILRRDYEMDVTCVDYIPMQVEYAKELGFDTLSVDLDNSAETIDLIANEHTNLFDLVVSLATIEHVFNADNLLRFCHTVLKPGGWLLVNTPNIGFAGYRLYSMLSGNRPFGEGHHVRFWDFRFLRTHLFLNGFSRFKDCRSFHSLPLDPLVRAFRGRKRLAGIVARLFYSCFLFQRIPWLRGLCTEELTVLARKDDIPPIGFELPTVRRSLERLQGKDRAKAVERLKEARGLGWMNEHLNLASFVDHLEPKSEQA